MFHLDTSLILRCSPSTALWIFSRRFSEKLLYGDELIRKPSSRIKPNPVQRASVTVPNPHNSRTAVFTSGRESLKQARIAKQAYAELEGNDPRLCDAIEVARGRRARQSPVSPAMRTVVLEGEQLIMDALASGGHVHSLYFSSRHALQRLVSTERIEDIYYVPRHTLERFSSMKTCPGLLAIFEVPDPASLTTRYLSHGLWRPLPATLVLNGIRDPGNMGSLLRTAASFGLSSVLVSEGSVDIWNEKVIRAGMSSHFRIPVYQNLSWREIGERLADEAAQFLGTSGGNNVKVFVADVASEETEKRIAECSKIEAVATQAVGSDIDLEDDSEETFEATFPASFRSFVSDPATATAYRLPLPSAPHFRISYFSAGPPVDETPSCKLPSEKIDFKPVLVVGSEVEGLSPEAYYLAHLTGGSRIVIPSSPDTESLNVLAATSTILGEMQRQYLDH
ncbi:hypothetical protein T265_02520 [Opisthorchis viverrini]|uniref:tRNA/rRNA methyltransferase SpoU type domain-containing protein n=1 Tax=Opisthorchis viverrini TaxID=6198 RepID=A0A074ZVS0_OPIVI|nr:hypothetical protein T265_02520 [Opisthorchis viverrini]KER31196.1 hypothetical protein T265_02520 [Opisthorchis viverrini]